ncbi:methyl-accepting chemotaxis protein [Leptospira sp. GIMC2001]|uniref:methyl-accepting chemotaxis protein n=1 Tax=Leptospira sp. GIMC2001 TaxID=1513297 RepID=UPI00234A806C|nr:methyl-accepting chemotaxis protein [Leptospira sp. GIMC2001]WCL47815.1 methyl-accepting chemotaxis protein [Leptospira sp. GIMC2001]
MEIVKVINSYKKKFWWGISLEVSSSTIILLVLLDLAFIQQIPSLKKYLIAIGFFGLSISIVLRLVTYIALRPLEEKSIQRIDPVLLLMGKGLDLYGFLEMVTDSTQSVQQRIDQIEKEILELDAKIHETTTDMDNVFQIVTQLANQEVILMDDVGKTSEEIHFMFEIVNSVIDEIDSRNDNMKNLVEMSQAGGEKVQKTNAIIKSISEKADDTLKLVDFINNITKETNLLAINAAIEASHSDSEGKGFAVIADEMKKLAVLTSQKAKEVTKLLRDNTDDYKYAHKASDESGEAFQFISSQIHIISGTIAEVVQTIGELKSRGGDVIKKAEILDKSAEAVKNSSGEVYGEIVAINETLGFIGELSAKLKDEVQKIVRLQKSIAEKSAIVQEIALKINQETDEFLGLD